MKAKHSLIAIALAVVIAVGALPARAQRIAQAHYKKALVVGAHPTTPKPLPAAPCWCLRARAARW